RGGSAGGGLLRSRHHRGRTGGTGLCRPGPAPPRPKAHSGAPARGLRLPGRTPPRHHGKPGSQIGRASCRETLYSREVAASISSRRRHTRFSRDWSSDVCSSDLAGDQPGVDYYEADITVDELAELVFADLGLPHLDQKPTPELQQEAFAFRDVRRHGITGNLDRRRTLLAALKRAQQARGDPAAPVAITREDLRFKTWEEELQEQASAVVLAMMDTSSSMGACV